MAGRIVINPKRRFSVRWWQTAFLPPHCPRERQRMKRMELSHVDAPYPFVSFSLPSFFLFLAWLALLFDSEQLEGESMQGSAGQINIALTRCFLWGRKCVRVILPWPQRACSGTVNFCDLSLCMHPYSTRERDSFMLKTNVCSRTSRGKQPPSVSHNGCSVSGRTGTSRRSSPGQEPLRRELTKRT